MKVTKKTTLLITKDEILNALRHAGYAIKKDCEVERERGGLFSGLTFTWEDTTEPTLTAPPEATS